MEKISEDFPIVTDMIGNARKPRDLPVSERTGLSATSPALAERSRFEACQRSKRRTLFRRLESRVGFLILC